MGFHTLAPITVTAPSTATRITATNTFCQEVTFQCDPDNLAPIWLGDSNVAGSTTDRGFFMSVTDGDAHPAQIKFAAYSGANPINLADFWFLSTHSLAKINVAYVQV